MFDEWVELKKFNQKFFQKFSTYSRVYTVGLFYSYIYFFLIYKTTHFDVKFKVTFFDVPVYDVSSFDATPATIPGLDS